MTNVKFDMLCVADVLRGLEEVSEKLHSPLHSHEELVHLLTVEPDKALLHLP